MKSPIHSSLGIVGCLLASGMVTLPLLAADETTGAPKSIFNLPTSSKEGRDPFFPDSDRPYEIAAAANPVPGSLIPGIPASVTTATLPVAARSRIAAVDVAALCS